MKCSIGLISTLISNFCIHFPLPNCCFSFLFFISSFVTYLCGAMWCSYIITRGLVVGWLYITRRLDPIPVSGDWNPGNAGKFIPLSPRWKLRWAFRSGGLQMSGINFFSISCQAIMRCFPFTESSVWNTMASDKQRGHITEEADWAEGMIGGLRELMELQRADLLRASSFCTAHIAHLLSPWIFSTAL